MRLELVAAAIWLGIGSAHAAELAGGPIDGGFNQRTAVCYFFNAGTAAVTLANPRILNLNGSAVSLTVNECAGGTLGVFKSCGIAATVSNSTIYSCKVTVTPSKQNVRGILDTRTSSQVTLQNIELR